MKAVMADLFARFVAEVGQRDFACLRIAQKWPVEDSTALRGPIGTLLLHGHNDDGTTEALALVALTPPHLATGDPALLQFVIRRAQATRAPYFLTWTLRDAALWRTPKPGAPAATNNLEKLRDYEDNYDIAPGDAPHMFHEARRLQLLATARRLLDDLKRLHKDQALELVNVDATWFVGRLIDSVHELLPLVTDSLHNRLGIEDTLRVNVEKWAVAQGIAGSAADREFVESITRQIIYRLLGKVLFYQSLRRAARQLPPLNVDGIENSEVLPTLNRAFAEALKIDYHAVFAERQLYTDGNDQGLPWPEGTWVKNRQPGWYSLPESETNPSQIFFSKAQDDAHFHRFSRTKLIPDQRLYYLAPVKGTSAALVSALLNSSVCALATELAGPVTMGDGVLELRVEDARDYMLVPDLRSAASAAKKAIIDAFGKVCEREIGDVFGEVKQKDRQALDTAVLRAIGLDPKKYLQPIYNGLCELVRERIELGRMRGKARKTKARKTTAEKQTLQDVLVEQLPNGPHRFPEDFFSDAAKAGAKTEVLLPEDEFHLNTDPITMGLYTKSGGCVRHIKSPIEGMFLVYAKQSGHKAAQVPSKPVEVSRTVKNYEGYLRELRKRLYQAFYNRTLDARAATTLTQSVFDKFHLPKAET
ncbi:hypothetical protein SBV1_1410002 [Verrucomicrobia bacterium]|nr:hypothetical protein SBV1_1410002 [Verrucomicrobiota bacterium]